MTLLWHALLQLAPQPWLSRWTTSDSHHSVYLLAFSGNDIKKFDCVCVWIENWLQTVKSKLHWQLFKGVDPYPLHSISTLWIMMQSLSSMFGISASIAWPTWFDVLRKRCNDLSGYISMKKNDWFTRNFWYILLPSLSEFLIASKCFHVSSIYTIGSFNSQMIFIRIQKHVWD